MSELYEILTQLTVEQRVLLLVTLFMLLLIAFLPIFLLFDIYKTHREYTSSLENGEPKLFCLLFFTVTYSIIGIILCFSLLIKFIQQILQ